MYMHMYTHNIHIYTHTPEHSDNFGFKRSALQNNTYNIA